MRATRCNVINCNEGSIT